jgi:hypothetical protein
MADKSVKLSELMSTGKKRKEKSSKRFASSYKEAKEAAYGRK